MTEPFYGRVPSSNTREVTFRCNAIKEAMMLATPLHGLNVQIAHIQRVLFDKLPSALDIFTHQR